MSRAQRRALVEREAPRLPIVQQCRLLAVSRAWVYRKPAEVSAEDLAIMVLIDRQYLVRPYYGSRRMAAWLATQGHVVNRKRVQRLMRLLALVAIYQRPNTSKSAAAHKIYPYLLGGMTIERVNQVWCADVTYIPMAKGFVYLVVIMDWVSRAVLAWRLSNTLIPDFCVEALEEALFRHGRPEICKIGDERRTAFRRSVSRRLFPNRTCAFRYASGSPEDMAKSGVLIHARRNRSTRVQLSRYCSTTPSRQSRLVGRRRLG